MSQQYHSLGFLGTERNLAEQERDSSLRIME